MQKLGLHLRAHLANFVEQQSAAMGLFKFAWLVLDRARKCALAVPKQFAFEQIGRQCRTIHIHKAMLRTPRMLMNQVRDHFLARAALAKNQNRSIHVRQKLDLPIDLQHGGRRGKEVPSIRPIPRESVRFRKLAHEFVRVMLESPSSCSCSIGHGPETRSSIDENIVLDDRPLQENLQLRELRPGSCRAAHPHREQGKRRTFEEA